MVEIIRLLANFIAILFQILSIAIVIRALLSWFPVRPDHPLVMVLHDITEPILAPLRRVVPMIGPFDITPIVALLLLQLLQEQVPRMLFMFAG